MEKEFLGKKIAILGYGIENQTLLLWLVKHGANDITICDRDIKLKTKNEKRKTTTQNLKLGYQLGKDYLKNLQDFDIVFRTPGIAYLSPEIQQAKRSGVEISSQIKLFSSDIF